MLNGDHSADHRHFRNGTPDRTVRWIIGETASGAGRGRGGLARKCLSTLRLNPCVSASDQQ